MFASTWMASDAQVAPDHTAAKPNNINPKLKALGCPVAVLLQHRRLLQSHHLRVHPRQQLAAAAVRVVCIQTAKAAASTPLGPYTLKTPKVPASSRAADALAASSIQLPASANCM
jgi:hypothetical protein